MVQIQSHAETSGQRLAHKFAEMVDFGYAILSSELNIIEANQVFSNLLEIDRPSHASNFTHILDHLIQRGDFHPENTDTVKSRILGALDKQVRQTSDDIVEEHITLPSGLSAELKIKSFDNNHLVLTIKEEQIRILGHPSEYIKEVMDLAESGYWVYDCRTEDLQINIGHMIRKLDIGDGPTNGIEACWNAVIAEDIPKTKAAISTLLKSKRQTEITVRLKTFDPRSMWVRARMSPMLDEAKEVKAIVCHFVNVTNSLRIQNQLRIDAEKAQKTLKAKNSFLGRMSHEVRTPMNAVIGISDALIHHHGDPKILPKLELIQTSAEKVVRLVDETLEQTKLDEDKLELNPRAASPRKAIESVCQLWETKALKDGTDLRLEIDPSVPEQMFFDDFRYEQCINNLLSNALKFTPGGKIQVVLTTLEKGGKQLVLVVKDNGLGMTKQQQASIYEAYTQADKTISGRFGGTGLGMHITKRIIELMGGRITLQSIPGEGSVFALILPIQEIETNHHQTQSTELVNSLLSKMDKRKSEYSHLRVIVADDNLTNHMVIGSLLDTVVKEMHYAENGQEVLDILSQKPVDLILMDIHMPIMDGVEATLAIRNSSESWANIPIVALTADPEYQQKRLCQNLGMNSALAKPVKLTEVLSAFDNIFKEAEQEPLFAA